MTTDQLALMDQRRRDGVVSLLDQFIRTPRTAEEKTVIARDFKVTVHELDALFDRAMSNDPRIALHARATINLLASGAGKRRRQ